MRILHIVPGAPYGGMQWLVSDLASEQTRQGMDVRVLVIYDSPALLAEMDANGVRCHTVAGRRPSLRALMRYRSLIREMAPDLVHLHGGLLWSNLLGLSDKRCPWLFHAHSYPPDSTEIRTRLLKFTNSRLTDAIVGVSRSVSDAFRQGNRTGVPVFTVYNGVRMPENPEFLSVRRRKGCTFGMATRFAADKGVLEFVEVASEIARRLPEASFALAGEGPLLEEARLRAAGRGLAGRFRFPGFIRDVNQFWADLDVCIFTAPREAFGIRLIEPMLLGIPVVAYLTGAGSDELIRDGENALTAPWGNPMALADVAVRMATDTTAALALASRAQHFAQETFSITGMARKITSVYERLRVTPLSSN